MVKKAIGLNEAGILIAALPADGTAPAENAYAALGKTYKDTATLETAEGETVACECEEMDEPEDEIYIPGTTTLKFSTSDLDPETCFMAFGGTLSEDKKTWEAPQSFSSKEVAVRFTTRSGLEVNIGRAKMSTRINWAIKRDGYGLLEHSLTVLTPKVAGVKKMSVTDTTIANQPNA
ncbi:hypothetical protein [uncultured Rikenella sp.]|uniref:hypothetical protein n=1 Tax=uncultured Rikenella sp. TaxID=368003 RepID=UPI00262FE6F5|nr:hypothetical protein [uncultured Rikenella sp.]